MALSLSMSPNVESVLLEPTGDQQLVQTKIFLNGLSNKMTKSQVEALTRSSKVTIGLDEPHRATISGFGLFAPFLGLPSMRRLEGREINATEDSLQDCIAGQSAVAKLSLRHCHISAKAYGDLLRCFKALKTFEYSDWNRFSGYKFHNSEESLEPQRIRDIILEYAKDTLETLNFEFYCNKVIQGIGSLRKFTTLKSITLNAILLQADQNLPRLVDILPQSVEDFSVKNLEILPCYWGKLAKNLFSGLPLMQEALVPSLHYISFGFTEIDTVISLKYPPGVHHRTGSELLQDEKLKLYTLIEYLTWLNLWDSMLQTLESL